MYGFCAPITTTAGSMARKIPSPARWPCLKKRALSGSLPNPAGSPSGPSSICSWDGEEPMLLGSTEWAEEHAEELRQHAAIYINSDGNDRGYLAAAGLALA